MILEKKGGLLGVGPYVTKVGSFSYGEKGKQIYEYIPIDFIRCNVIDFDTRRLLENSNLNFTRYINEETGETTQNFRKAKFKNMEIRLYESGRCTLSGSVHKFYNNGAHNYNDFDSAAFLKSLEGIYSAFELRPKNLHITNLEFGYNLHLPFDAKVILDGLIMHKGSWFETRMHGPKAYYKTANHNRYTVKCYDKSLQYGLRFPVLRFERNECNWTDWRKKGIFTLQDFIEAPKAKFIKALVDTWSDIVYYNHSPENGPDHSKYERISFWSDLEVREVTRTTFMRHRKKMKKLNSKVFPDRQKLVADMLVSCYQAHNSGVTFSNTCPVIIHLRNYFDLALASA